MRPHDKPPKTPQENRPGPESVEGKPPEKKGTDRQRPGGEDVDTSEKPSEEELAKPWTEPVTNQDEQEKITNTGGDGLPIPKQ